MTTRTRTTHTFTSPTGKMNLIRFNNRSRILTAIREGRVELAIARKNALAGIGSWEEVSLIESEIENLTEILSDIYL